MHEDKSCFWSTFGLGKDTFKHFEGISFLHLLDCILHDVVGSEFEVETDSLEEPLYCLSVLSSVSVYISY